MNFLRGFQAAFRGIIRCINHERNMRIHTVAALYVFVFSFFFEFSITGYAVLFTVFGLIMGFHDFGSRKEMKYAAHVIAERMNQLLEAKE